MNAKKVCGYTCCPHNMLFQVFNVPREPIVTPLVQESGACMLEITHQDELDGVAGMRRGASIGEIAEIYQVNQNAVKECIDRALKKMRNMLDLR